MGGNLPCRRVPPGSISWIAFSVSRIESSRSCRCAVRKSCRCCASWNSVQAVGFTAPRFSIVVFVSWYEASAACSTSIETLFRRLQLRDRDVQFLPARLIDSAHLAKSRGSVQAMISKQTNYRFDVDRPHLCHLGQDRMKRPRLKRVVQGNGDHMDRRTIVSHPAVTALLPNHAINQTLQRADQTISKYVPRQFHAAWTGINSSFT